MELISKVKLDRPLVGELKRWFHEAEFAPDEPLWPKLTDKTADMLKRDLAAAGILYVDEAGLYADFHALRRSYVSFITSGRVHPKIAQRLARHSATATGRTSGPSGSQDSPEACPPPGHKSHHEPVQSHPYGG